MILKLFSFLQRFTKKSAICCIDNLSEYNYDAVDAYSFFCYLQKHKIKSYYVVLKNSHIHEKLKKEHNKKHIIVCDKNGLNFIYKGFFKLLFVKQIIFSFLVWGGFSKKREKLNTFFRDNQYITTIFLNHGPTLFKCKGVSRYFNKYNFNKLIVSNDIEKHIYKKYMNWEDKDIIECGLPRWDMLKKCNNKNIFVFFTYRESFRNAANVWDFKYFHEIVSLLNNKELQELLKKSGLNLKFVWHHAFDNYCGLHNIDINDMVEDKSCIDFVSSENVHKYINDSCLMITDYSSIVFDFMYLNIPVLFYWFDFSDRRLNIQDLGDFHHISKQKDLIYNVFYDQKKLISKIGNYIKNGFQLEEKFKQKNRLFFYNKEQISEKLFVFLNRL